MKTLLSITALAAFGLTTAAAAEDVGGNVEAICSLPPAFVAHSTTGGAQNSQFVGGNTWNIPPSQLASANGTAVASNEIAIRLRGVGVCNTSHRITLTSLRGGLASALTTDPGYVRPTGFSDRRAVHYEAYWVASGVSSASVPLGPRAQVTASAPAATNTATYTVGAALAPPGNRNFDLRMGINRGALVGPMLAGAYSDTVTLTIAFP